MDSNIVEEIGRVANILEDSIDQQDWETVKKAYQILDELYITLDRGGYSDDYYDYE